jgi:hypothetical protein
LASQNQVDPREKIGGKVTPTSGRVETADDTVGLLEVLRTGAVRGFVSPVPSAWFVLDNKVMRMEKRATGLAEVRCLLAILTKWFSSLGQITGSCDFLTRKCRDATICLIMAERF